MGEIREADTMSYSRRHAEAVQSINIWGDTLRAERIWREIIAEDSLYAPALYSLSRLSSVKMREAVDFAQRAYHADSSNKWYCDQYVVLLLRLRLYDQALPVCKRFVQISKHDPAGYFYLANLYMMKHMPFSAIAVLDSADMRIRYNDQLARVKQQLLLDTRQYNRAIEEGEKLVFNLPTDVEAHLQLARSYAAAKRDSLAEATYQAAYRIDTTDVSTLQQMWDFYVQKNNSQRVFEIERKLLRNELIPLESKKERVVEYVSNAELYNQYYEEIGQLIEILSEDYPTDRDVVSLWTKHLYFTDRDEQALSYLHSHLEDDNVTADDFILALGLDEVMGKGMLYILDLDRGLELFPENLHLNTLAALWYHKLGDTKAAVKVLRRSLKYAQSREDYSTLWCTMGDFYYDDQNTKKAFAAYEKALDYNPENASALNNYAYFLALAGERLDEALSMAQLAITLHENNANYIDTYAWILHLMGRNEEAKRYMLQALSISRQQDVNLLVHYADILWEMGDKTLAQSYWNKAKEGGYDAEELEAHINSLKNQSN